MKIPFLKEVVWSVYPPRYKQLAEKRFRDSLKYMSLLLLLAFIISGIFLIPNVLTIKSNVQQGLSNFDVFKFSGNVTQSAPLTIPTRDPWVVVDLNGNHTLTSEMLVIDSELVQYRFFGIKKFNRDHLKDPATHSARVSTFFTVILLLMLPGIALLMYIRMWLKYFLMIFLLSVVFFIVLELTKFRLKWKQTLNIVTHALTIIIPIEVIAAAISGKALFPFGRFLGVNLYAATIIAFAVLIIVGIVGFWIGSKKK